MESYSGIKKLLVWIKNMFYQKKNTIEFSCDFWIPLFYSLSTTWQRFQYKIRLGIIQQIEPKKIISNWIQTLSD